eukprot:c34911_g1_i1.p1 GENE.c34911_g1_i1~~c34911_g1_i1.p1  ORF type:complete len:250 (+),score=46.16 c34911_g1_i1:138-887(+)
MAVETVVFRLPASKVVAGDDEVTTERRERPQPGVVVPRPMRAEHHWHALEGEEPPISLALLQEDVYALAVALADHIGLTAPETAATNCLQRAQETQLLLARVGAAHAASAKGSKTRFVSKKVAPSILGAQTLSSAAARKVAKVLGVLLEPPTEASTTLSREIDLWRDLQRLVMRTHSALPTSLHFHAVSLTRSFNESQQRILKQQQESADVVRVVRSRAFNSTLAGQVVAATELDDSSSIDSDLLSEDE